MGQIAAMITYVGKHIILHKNNYMHNQMKAQDCCIEGDRIIELFF